MDPTDPKPTTRGRRWRLLLVCGVIGLVVGVLLAGLFLDEFPPDDADLAPHVVPQFTGESNPFLREEIRNFEPAHVSGLAGLIWNHSIEFLDAWVREKCRDNPELLVMRDELRPVCITFEREFSRVGGDPWVPDSDVPRWIKIQLFGQRSYSDRGRRLAEPRALEALARLEWLQGNADETLRWVELRIRAALLACETARSLAEWEQATSSLSSATRALQWWVEVGLLHAVSRSRANDFVRATVPWVHGARLFHAAHLDSTSTPDEVDARWKSNRFRRRLGEVIRPVLEDPSRDFVVEPEPWWVRWWIDPHSSRVLEDVVSWLQDERYFCRDMAQEIALYPVAAAIRPFEEERLAWPETVEDLVPTYLPEIPPALAPPVQVRFELETRTLWVGEADIPLYSRWTLPAQVR